MIGQRQRWASHPNLLDRESIPNTLAGLGLPARVTPAGGSARQRGAIAGRVAIAGVALAALALLIALAGGRMP